MISKWLAHGIWTWALPQKDTTHPVAILPKSMPPGRFLWHRHPVCGEYPIVFHSNTDFWEDFGEAAMCRESISERIDNTPPATRHIGPGAAKQKP